MYNFIEIDAVKDTHGVNIDIEFDDIRDYGLQVDRTFVDSWVGFRQESLARGVLRPLIAIRQDSYRCFR